jgi:uncharacterized membrane protein
VSAARRVRDLAAGLRSRSLRSARRRARIARRRERVTRRREFLHRCALRLRPERTRSGISIGVAIIAFLVVRLAYPPLIDAVEASAPWTRLGAVGALVVLIAIVYSVVMALVTHATLVRLDRGELVVTVREARARHSSQWVRLRDGGASASTEMLQMVLIAVVAVVLVINPPEGVPVPLLLVLALAAMAATWYESVVSFAVEYASEDAREEAFRMPERPPLFEDYLHLAWLTQATSSAADIVPRTRGARRLVRSQTVLAQIMNTVVIALGLSAVTSAI